MAYVHPILYEIHNSQQPYSTFIEERETQRECERYNTRTTATLTPAIYTDCNDSDSIISRLRTIEDTNPNLFPNTIDTDGKESDRMILQVQTL